MKHANRSQPGDCGENFEYGKYWNRHRELDNLLSGAFMFLPERFRLPQNVRDPVAVHTNLHLHAAVICLHNSAYEMANEHNLPQHLKSMIKTRLLSASNEVVNIVKLTSHTNASYVSVDIFQRPAIYSDQKLTCALCQRSPLVALAFYVASSVYTSQAQEEGLTPTHKANLELLFAAMGLVGKQNRITLSFLRQALLELTEAGLDSLVRTPKLAPHAEPLAGDLAQPCGQIPLFARSRSSKRTAGIMPPLPGRLPLNRPLGMRPANFAALEIIDSPGGADALDLEPRLRASTGEGESRNVSKRRRVNLSPESSAMRSGTNNSTWCEHAPVEELSSSDTTPRGSSLSLASRNNTETSSGQFSLPHRGGSSTSGSSPSAAVTSSATSMSPPGVSPGGHTTHGAANQLPDGGFAMANQAGSTGGFGVAVNTAVGPAAGADHAMVLDMFQGLNGWSAAQTGCPDPSVAYDEVTEAMLNDDSWMVLNDVGVNGQPWDTSGEGAAAG